MTTYDLDARKRIGRLRAESMYITRQFGDVRFDQEDGTWFYVTSFELPNGWNKSTVELLIDIPSGTPGYPSVAPQWFWTDHDLCTHRGLPIGHFFKANPDQIHDAKGWGHFCVHANEWRPSRGTDLKNGHSLITYLNLIRTIFHDHRTLSGG